jgi:hypothetical protein
MRPAYLGVWLCVAASVPVAPPAPPRADDDAPLVHLRFAELRDRDGSGGATAGDEVVLGLRRALGPRRKVSLSDLPLAATTDLWGEGATVSALAGRDELTVTLGRGTALTTSGTYRPGAASPTPSLVRTQSGPVPVLPATAERRAFAGDRFPDGPELRAFHGQLHAHTSYSDGLLTPAEAFAAARRELLDFFAVTDHLEQLDDDEWARTRAAADRAQAPGSFAALYGYEWGGAPSFGGWLNHVNVIGSDERLGTWTLRLRSLYSAIGRLPGPHVVGQFNHPGMVKGWLGRNNWNDFAYDAAADLRMKLVMVETRSDNDENNREEAGLVPALDRGWHVAPKGEEDNHIANWGRSGRRTGLWLPALTKESVLSGLARMATFYTDEPGASLKLTGDGEWLMGSTLYGADPHRLTVAVAHARRIAQVTSVEIVSLGGSVVARHAGGRTPFTADFTVDPAQDAYFFARIALESAETRMISAPLYVDR